MDDQVERLQVKLEAETISKKREITPLEQVRQRTLETYELELNAKLVRLRQHKTILLEEAGKLLAMPPSRSRHLVTIAKDFEQLVEEQRVLLDKISETTGLYLSFKRQSGKLETEVIELRRALDTLHQQLQTKESLARKLYMANEALLRRLGLDEERSES
ncbi:hypothetical protein P43SY_005832 [Pythium insidiosum]|uniref:Uncharacterized protein n=1 Tax=Pythium insidiosum TaxID=114742 RepID=A0AAD5LUK9_PYTIN|nr:hypothetical protein P43SY_005832 [Pythium insidiosum]